MKNGFYIQIHEGYTATVRNLDSFRSLLNRPNQIFDNSFGTITYADDSASAEFVDALKALIAEKKKSLCPSPKFIQRMENNKLIAEFKNDFLFANITAMGKAIKEERKKAKERAKYEWKLSTRLMSTSGGQLLILDDGGRIGEPSWMENAHHYRNDIPSMEELIDLYSRIRVDGVTKFRIHYESMVRYWDDFQKKFSGWEEEPSDNWASLDLVYCDR